MGVAKDAIDAARTVGELAKDNPEMREAGKSLARSARVVARSLELVLLPLAVANAGLARAQAYFKEKFPEEFEAKVAKIPEENLQEPKLSIAAQAIQGLSYSFDDDKLREMYVELLARAMDSSSVAHPAFVEVIRQLESKEARFLHMVSRSAVVPIAKLRVEIAQTGEGQDTATHLIPATNEEGDIAEFEDVPTWIDNWVRLGLYEVDYGIALAEASMYDYVTKLPSYAAATERVKVDEHFTELVVVRGRMRLTNFGRRFAETVLPSES